MNPAYIGNLKECIFSLFLAFCLTACASSSVPSSYVNPEFDFAAIRRVAVMPFANTLLSTAAVYVLPTGEVARGIARAGIVNPTAPSVEEIARLAGIIEVDAVFTGTINEYGEVRSGSATANMISMIVQMVETQTGKVVWTASATKGGITIWDRLFGSGGRPMSDVTQDAVDELMDKLFR